MLVVETVLVLSLPSVDRRDCGRRAVDFPKLLSEIENEFDVTRMLVDLSNDDLFRSPKSIESSRNGDDVGLDNLRRFFSLSFDGDGVICSSIIRTQPDVSAADFVVSEVLDFPPGSDSILLLTLTLRVSGVLNSCDDVEVLIGRAEGIAEAGALPDAFRPAVLPTRNRGTRECNRCSKFRTLARISETICTPLLFDGAPKLGAVTSV